MLIACWSAKGGSGTTVVAASLALLLAERTPGGASIADLAGDVPAVLGIADPPAPGLAEWMAAGTDVPADAIERLAAPAPGGVRVLAAGDPSTSASRSADDGERLAVALAGRGAVVVDCGSAPTAAGWALAGVASVSLLVVRPCLLALRRAIAAPIRPSGVVLVEEPGRALRREDIEDALGVPVRATVPAHPSVARAVDAGLLAERLPRHLARALREAAA